MLTACSKDPVLSSTDFKMYSVSPDQLYCGAPVAGASLVTGHYSLTSVKNSLDLGELTLVSGTPHDALHLLPMQVDGKALYKLAQYETCNSESVRLFSLDSDGKIEALPFIKDGVSSTEVSSDYQAMIEYKDGVFSFCPYDNLSGQSLCDAYQYKDGAFEYLQAS